MPQKRLIILNYHQVSKKFDPQFNHQNIWLDAKLFEEQLKQLASNYCVLPLPVAIKKLQNKEINQPTLALTFDDGDISVQHTIVPLLEKYKIPATFFINSAYLDSNKSYWFVLDYYIQNNHELRKKITPKYTEAINNIRRTDSPKKYREYRAIIESLQDLIPNDVRFHVSYDFLENLNPDLFSVGLHGHEHQRYSMMSNNWKKENLIKNIAILKNLPTYFNGFAIPFGSPIDWDASSVEIAKELNLHFFLATKGYNTKYSNILFRDSLDATSIEAFLESQSPIANRYKKLNGIY